MKKKIWAAVLTMAFLILPLSGCGSKSDTTTEGQNSDGASVQEEVVKMVNEDLPSIAADRDKAVAAYNAYFESEPTASASDAWKNTLQNDALVSYDTYLANLGNITYQNQEVESLKDLYQQSAELQRDAIQDVVDALNSADSEKLESANVKIHNSMVYLKQYEDGLKSLCDQYGIVCNGDFQTASMTDATLMEDPATATDATDADAEAE